MKYQIYFVLLAASFLSTGCSESRMSALESENRKLRSRVELLEKDVELLRRQVNVAIAAATNSLELAEQHGEMIGNVNEQLITISDALVKGLNTEIAREKNQLVR